MSQDRKSRINYRCPNCFAKEVDVDLLYDKKKDEYYCVKCCFVGTTNGTFYTTAETHLDHLGVGLKY